MSARPRRPWLVAAVGTVLVAGALAVAAATTVSLYHFRDVGYPDSANLLVIREFVHTGRLYPDPDSPPYMMTLYGPLLYVLLGAAYALGEITGGDPQIAVRLVVVAAFCACGALVYLIARRLYGSRATGAVCLLFAISMPPLARWTGQVRGDFIALALSLLAVYLFLEPRPAWRLAAGAICAGLAPLVKQTFVAAAVAIVLWLLWRRRFKLALACGAAMLGTCLAGYGIMLWREPGMWRHLAVLGSPLLEWRAGIEILWKALTQVPVTFAVLGGLAAWRKRSQEDLLLLCYALAAWLVALATLPQAGGNINYYWEPLMASGAFAGAGLLLLQRRLFRAHALVTALVLILLLLSFGPLLLSDARQLKDSFHKWRTYSRDKAKWQTVVSVLKGRRLLTTYPDLTFHSRPAILPEPFLFSYLERQNKWRHTPLVSAVEAGEFEVIVVPLDWRERLVFRGIRFWPEEMWRALESRYTLACVDDGTGFWTPHGAGSEVVERLKAAGCQPGPG